MARVVCLPVVPLGGGGSTVAGLPVFSVGASIGPVSSVPPELRCGVASRALPQYHAQLHQYTKHCLHDWMRCDSMVYMNEL